MIGQGLSMSGTPSSRLMGTIVAQRRSYATAASATGSGSVVASISFLPAQHRLLLSYRCLSTLILDNHDRARALSQRRVVVLQSSSSWELLLSSAVAAFLSGVALYQATNSNRSINNNTTAIYSSASSSSNHQHPGFGFSSWGGGSGGNSMPPSSQPPLVLGKTRQQQQPGEETEHEPGVSDMDHGGASFDVSVRAVKGGRLYMEDDYYIGNGGKFVGVFDGHGGGDVSCHLRKHLHRNFQLQLERKRWEWDHDDSPSHDNRNAKTYSSPQQLHSFVAALRAAFDAVDREVLEKDAMQYQGSTAVAVAIHIGEDGGRTLVSANVGDSRAVLCRNGSAVDLTHDHKPNDERERARIEKMGEQIEWDNYSKVHRVKNLSLSRAIGDRFAKPTVSGEAEISLFPVREDDEFVVLASDGVWDVMTSEQVVQFIQEKLDAVKASNGSNLAGTENLTLRLQDARRKTMSRYVVSEALKRGSGDNICVVIVWLKPLKKA